MKIVTKFLPVILTQSELLDISKKSVEKTLEVDRIEELKKKITPLRDEVTELSKKFKDGYEMRPVTCKVLFHTPVNGRKTIIREDTGETVEVLNMDLEEMQEAFEFQEAEILEEIKQLTEGK
jgi:predicted transcriptional regulator